MAGEITDLRQAVIDGDCYIVSYDEVLGNNAAVVLHFDHPSSDALSYYFEPPQIFGDATAEVRTWENATVSNLQGDVIVHNVKYDEQEEPTGRVDRPASLSDLDTSGADQTQGGFIQEGGGSFQSSGAPGSRAFWRVIPPTEALSVVIQNSSGGDNRFGFDCIVYERETWP